MDEADAPSTSDHLADVLPRFGKLVTDAGKLMVTVHGQLERLWTQMAHRGPDPDIDDERYTRREVNLLRGEAYQQARRQYGGIHGGDGSKRVLHAWNVITVAIVIGVGAWVRDSISELRAVEDAHSHQLARMECQLSPETCRQLQVPHVP